MDKTSWGKTIGYTVIYLGFFSMGIVGGMLIQQTITQATLMKVADSLDGINVEIDFNETKIVEEITDFYKPYLEEVIKEDEPYFNKEDLSWYMKINETLYTWNIEENIWYEV